MKHVVITEDSTVQEAQRMMTDGNVGSLAVTNRDRSIVVGTLTESEINDKVRAKGQDMSRVRAAEVMNKTIQAQKAGTEEVLESMATKGGIDL
jgi:predicted transcriptional regulator